LKGIILAGGNGSRLHPITSVVTKQLLPVYDKPMIHYPLATLILAGITEILIICKRGDDKLFKQLLGNGSKYGITLQYKIQDNPNGIPEAFILGEEFIGNDSVCLALGDNIFHGHGLPTLLQKGVEMIDTFGGAVIFGHHVNNPERYGIVKQGKWGRILGIEEKPTRPKSNCAVVGLYMYDNSVIKMAKELKPSDRGETEITDLNREYLKDKKLRLIKFGRGYCWFDTGVADALLSASTYVQTIQKRQGLKISCIEETAHYMGRINNDQLRSLANEIGNPEYSQYLHNILEKDEE